MAKPAYLQLLLCLVLARHAYTQGPDSYYVQIFPNNPTTGPPLKLAEVHLTALNGGRVLKEQLTYTFTTGAPPQPVPSNDNNAACSDEIVEGAACAGDPKQPSTLTITFPSNVTVQEVVVQNADTGACPECDITFYQLKVVHAVGHEKVQGFGTDKQKKVFMLEGLDPTDLVSLNIQPRASAMSSAAPLVVYEIQLLSPDKSPIAPNLLKYTVQSIPKDNTTQSYVCGDSNGCNDGNFQSTCGACNTDATNFTITYPTWVIVSEVQVHNKSCSDAGCKDPITDYVLRFIHENGTATNVDTAFTRAPINGSVFSILSTEWLTPVPPPPMPSISPPLSPPPPGTTGGGGGGGGPNVPLIVGLSIAGAVVLGAVIAFFLARRNKSLKDTSALMPGAFKSIQDVFPKPSALKGSYYKQNVQSIKDVPVPHSSAPTGFYLPGRSPQDLEDSIRNVVGKVKTMVKLDDGNGDYIMLPTFLSSQDVKTDAMLMRYSLQHQCYLWLLANVWSDKAFEYWRRQVQAGTHQLSHSPGQMVVLVQPTPGVDEEESLWHSLKQLQNDTAQVDKLISEMAARMVQDLKLSTHSQQAVEKIILEALCFRFLLGCISASGGQIEVPGVRYGQPQLDPVRKLDDVHKEYSITALVPSPVAGQPLHQSRGGVLYCLEPGCAIGPGQRQPWSRSPVVVALVP